MGKADMGKNLVVLILAFVTSTAFGQVYRCDIDGQVVFSQQPCAEDAELLEERRSSHDAGREDTSPPSGARDDFSAAQSDSDDGQTFTQRVSLERRIATHQRSIRRLQSERDAQIADIRQRKSQAGNIATAETYTQSLTAQIESVNNSYASRIDNEQRSIDRLNNELQRLQ